MVSKASLPYDTKVHIVMPDTTGASYAAAGVDIEAGDRAVELMKEWVKKTRRPEVLGGLGGFAGLFDASALKNYERPLLASAGTGVVEADRLLGPDRIRTGDAVIAMASSGLHSNGYSLVRHVLLNEGGLALDAHLDGLGRTLGEELLEPTKIYSLDCLALMRTAEVHAFSHVTGGGLAANLARVIPDGLHAVVDRSTWTPGAIFDLVGRTGKVERLELEKTLNMGVGMIAIVPEESTDVALTALADRGVDAWVAGEITDRADHESGAALVGDYAA